MKEISDMTKLKSSVIESSESNRWIDAKEEWTIVCQYKSESLDHCACGHAIKNVVYIYNSLTDAHLKVGTTCVNKFKTISLKGIKANGDATPLYYIDEAHDNGVITTWEYNFIRSIWGFKKPSPKQNVIKIKIYNKIFKGLNIK